MKNALFTLFILSVLPSFGIWREVPTPSSENLNKLEIIDGITFCVGDNGTVLKSTDEGESWTSISTSATGNITAIKFIDNSTGFFTTSTGFIFKTINGGDDWNGSNIHTGGLNGIDFINENTGVAVGDNGFIFRTTNGGSSWTSLGSISVFSITGVTAITESLLVAVGTQGSYLVSEDAGASWTYKSISTTVAFSKIEKTPGSSAIAVGSGGYISEFSETTLTLSNASRIDDESDWIKDVFIRDFDGINRPVAVGFASTVLVLNSTWKTLDLDSINNLNGVHFFNDSIGLACGFNGKIYKTRTGAAPVSTKRIILEKTSVYPNPTRGNINLDKQVNNSELMVYNIEGKLVYQQFVQSQQINLSFLNNGLYFLRFLKDEKIFTVRVMKE